MLNYQLVKGLRLFFVVGQGLKFLEPKSQGKTHKISSARCFLKITQVPKAEY